MAGYFKRLLYDDFVYRQGQVLSNYMIVWYLRSLTNSPCSGDISTRETVMKTIALFFFISLPLVAWGATPPAIDCEKLLSSATIEKACGKDLKTDIKTEGKRYICYRTFKAEKGWVSFNLLKPSSDVETVNKSAFDFNRKMDNSRTEDFRSVSGIGSEAYTFKKRKTRYLKFRKKNYIVELESYNLKDTLCSEQQLSELSKGIVKTLP
jgi:hypothetical protein